MLTVKPAWLHAVIGYVVVEAILIAAAFGWVAFYSYALHPGESAAFYQAYAQDASPIVALIAGGPLLFLTGLLFGRMLLDRAQATTIALVAISMIVTIALLIVMKESRTYHWTVASISGLAQMSGGWLGSRRRP